MQSLLEVFRMNDISQKTRARVILKLGVAINNQYRMNITEPLVYEFVKLLDPENPRLKEPLFLELAGVKIQEGEE